MKTCEECNQERSDYCFANDDSVCDYCWAMGGH